MQTGEFILDRKLETIIRDACRELSIKVESFSDDWIFVLTRYEKTSIVYGYQFGLNSSSSAAISRDKVATYQLLDRAGIEAVPHVIVSTRATWHQDWKNKTKQWGRFIAKPIHGGGGRGLKLFDEPDQAEFYINNHTEQDWCVSPLLDIKKETRLIFLDNQLLLSYEKQNPVLLGDIPMFNLRLGATSRTVEASEELVGMARSAMSALGLRFAAVDVVETTNGDKRVLEINEGFSLEHYMLQSDDNYSRAKEVYVKVIKLLFR